MKRIIPIFPIIVALFIVASSFIDNPDIPDLKSGSIETFMVNGVSFEMVYVEGGTFTMGATSEQGKDAESDETPTHSVTLSSYFIGKYEVTQALWEAVMGGNPSHLKNDNLPVDCVSWDDIQLFITELNSLTGKNFALPTEPQWEYAARGGNKSKGYKYSGNDIPDNVAWHSDNSNEKTHPVGSKSPNELGLYDMSGNVAEWCLEWYGKYGNDNKRTSMTRIAGAIRGGNWQYGWLNCRVSARNRFFPNNGSEGIGFRLILLPSTDSQTAIPTQDPQFNTRSTGTFGSTKTFTVNGLSFEMVQVAGGTFTMGATPEQRSNAESNESPAHQVTLSTYSIGKYEVTVREFSEFIKETGYQTDADKNGWSTIYTGSEFAMKYDLNWKFGVDWVQRPLSDYDHPVIHVSHNDAVAYCEWLSKKTGKMFTLPTEAQWEYAARGGNKSKGYKYAGSNTVDYVAWHLGNSNRKTHQVGSKSPNELGLFDMTGNVEEWCFDRYGDYGSDSQTNPMGPDIGYSCALRGGSWNSYTRECRVSYRNSDQPGFSVDNCGFRLVLLP